MATFGVQANTIVGLGIEHTVGHYKAPQKYLPITSESLSVTNETVEGRELTGTSDVTYAKPGNESVEGSIEMDAKHDCIPWLLQAMRGTVIPTFTGTGADKIYTYRFIPNNEAVPSDGNTLSLTIKRANEIFLYTGVKVNRLGFDVNDGLLSMSLDVMGLDEDNIDASDPDNINFSSKLSATQLTELARAVNLGFTLTPPFGAGEYAIYIPSNKQNYGTDSFNLEIDDGGEILFRLRDDKRTPTINKWGERSVTSSNELDFISKAEYKNYRDVDITNLRYFCQFAKKITGTTDTKPYLNLFLPKVYLNDYSVDTSGGQGDLVRASGSYMAIKPAVEDHSVDSGGDRLDGVIVAGRPSASDWLTKQVYDLSLSTNEEVVKPFNTSYRAPTSPNLDGSRVFQWTLVKANRIMDKLSGFVIRWRPVGSSVFDWKVKEIFYDYPSGKSLADSATTFTLGTAINTADDGSLGTDSGTLPNGTIFTADDMASGVEYEIQVAQRLGATSVPGSGTIGDWSLLDDEEID